MSNVKVALKAAKSALDSQNYDEAALQANTVLNLDSQNYFAQVFLGRALDKQGKVHPAIEAYKAATKLKPEDELAWKGLSSAYAVLGSDGVDGHTEACMGLAHVYAEKDDKHQCQTIIDGIVSFAKENGNRQSYIRALQCYLPTSPIYDYLEGRVPHPAFTYTRIVELTETDEKERMNKEIGERRTRLGAKLGQVTAEVTREVFNRSSLEDLYQQVIEWTNDDEIRRTYEEKLLQRSYNHLVALAAEQKAEKRTQVIKLAHDMVIIKHPFQLAWQLELEWRDLENLSELDRNTLMEYILFFPESGLANIIRGFLGITEMKASDSGSTNGNAVAEEDKKSEKEGTKEEKDKWTPLTADDRLLVLLDGLAEAKQSAFAHRVVSDYYLQIEEYEGCTDVSRTAADLLYAECQKSGLQLQHSQDAIHSNLATSLVYFQSPKNHPEAKHLFDDILTRKPESTAALLGVGLIYEEQENFEEAASFLSRASQRDPTNMRIATEAAWCRVLKGDMEGGFDELQTHLENITQDKKAPLDLKAQTLYRVGKCMWDLQPSQSSRKSRNGPYARFIAALKANASYAPPYTSLGLYYADYSKDKKRARQCFQKAFELSGSEVLAAERLARDFAEEGEWDIVELIVQRVIDSGVAKPMPGSKRKGLSWPFAALGVVQMNKQEYPQACISFQAALRIAPGDYNAWVGLGESYHSSGRYIAAQKALEHAESLAALTKEDDTPVETWFARYMLANVMRELGDYDSALSAYEEILELRPTDLGVAIALLQTLVEQCNHHLENGFFSRAIDGASKALGAASEMATAHRGAFNYWKAVGDACTTFSCLPAYAHKVPEDSITTIFLEEPNPHMELDGLFDLDEVTWISIHEDNPEPTNPSEWCVRSLLWAIVAYKQAIYLSTTEIHAQAVAWYNLGLTEWKMQDCIHLQQTSSSNSKATHFAKAAVRCFKRAIELEASNADFWNALGVVTTKLNAKVAQHAFIRSLHLNERSARTWTNLGTLYLLQDDIELAHTAFGRAQSTDPDYAQAWLGEGLIAAVTGDAKEALSHFAHAAEITDASSPAVKTLYVTATFDNIFLASKQAPRLVDLTQPILALQQLQTQIADTFSIRHLLGLYQEMIGDFAGALDNLTVVCNAKEALYEEQEDNTSLSHYVKAKADLARIQLALGDYEAAAESAETALDLSGEPDPATFTSSERQKIRLSAHLTSGLAQYKLEAHDQALEMFRAALEESNSSPDVVCLLAQILWDKGGVEDRSVAKDQLFDCIEKHAGHVLATTLLGAMSSLDDDEATREAVLADLQNIRTSDGLSASQRSTLDSLQIKLGELNTATDASSEDAPQLATAIMVSPYQPLGWTALARATEAVYPAQMALKTASMSVPPMGDLSAEELSEAFAGTGSAGDAQRAITLCPWKTSGWESLLDCVA